MHLDVLFLKAAFDCFSCHIINDIKTMFEPFLSNVLDVGLETPSIIVSYLVSFIGAAKISFVVQLYRMKIAMYPSMPLMGKFLYC